VRNVICPVLTKQVTWNGYSEMTCCAFGPCGDAGSGDRAKAELPWASDDAEIIAGSFGDVFHPFMSQDERLLVSTHDFGMYRQWPLVSTEQIVYKGITLNTFRWPESRCFFGQRVGVFVSHSPFTPPIRVRSHQALSATSLWTLLKPTTTGCPLSPGF
jgi:hypothetical protein